MYQSEWHTAIAADTLAQVVRIQMLGITVLQCVTIHVLSVTQGLFCLPQLISDFRAGQEGQNTGWFNSLECSYLLMNQV